MTDILIASTNKHKVAEIEKILRSMKFNFLSLSAHPDLKPPAEDSKTFQGNALIKARYYYQHTGLPVIADDSGLVVPALGGEPGVLSARYAGKQASYSENNQLLLSHMQNFEGDQRAAYFICVAVYYDGGTLLVAEGRAEGIILRELRGSHGFGYDPLFLYPSAGKTFAEMMDSEKNQVSHRSKALESLYQQLGEILTK